MNIINFTRKMNFVKINNRILDKCKLRRQQLIIKNHIILSIYDLLQILGFKKTRNGFVNKDLNLKLDLKFDKAEKEIIV